MRQQHREPPPSDPWHLPHGVRCYRGGKQEHKGRPFRLLPGSQQILVGPECAQVLLGRPASEGRDEDTNEDGSRCSAGDELAPPDGQEEANL